MLSRKLSAWARKLKDPGLAIDENTDFLTSSSSVEDSAWLAVVEDLNADHLYMPPNEAKGAEGQATCPPSYILRYEVERYRTC